MGIVILLCLGLFHSITAQFQQQQPACTQQEQQLVRQCLQQAKQAGENVGVFQGVGLQQQSGPCMQAAGCNGGSTGFGNSGGGGGFGGIISQFTGGNSFFGGNNNQPQQPPPSNGNDDQCYKSVNKQIRQYVRDCIKRRIQNINDDDINGAIGGGGHRGQGGQGGQGGGQGQGQQSQIMQQLRQKCNNDRSKMSRVKTCMLNTPAGQQQYQQVLQKGCQCKRQVSPQCQQQLERIRRAACQCAHDIQQQNKYEQFEQQEPSCQGQSVEATGIVAVFQKMDCNTDPCQNQG